jgi:putative hydrolase of the HAD superfamily
MIKAIIFDADGMVTSSKMFSKELEKDFGIPAKKLLPFFESVFQKCLIGKANLKEELKNYIKAWGWKGTVDELTNYWFKVENEINNEVVEKIKKIREKNIKCYLATNQEQQRTNYLRDFMGLGKLFDAFWSSAELGVKKPSPEFFDAIYKEIGQDGKILKNEIMFWDDDEENVQEAEEYGLQAYLYHDFDNFNKIVDEGIK